MSFIQVNQSTFLNIYNIESVSIYTKHLNIIGISGKAYEVKEEYFHWVLEALKNLGMVADAEETESY